MTTIDFRQVAKEKAGVDRWSKLDETERRALIRDAKVEYLRTIFDEGGAPREDWPTWLRAQPPVVQDRILGATKGKLFRDGGLTVDKFSDAVGKPLTLDELAKTRPEAFSRAGLDPDAFRKGQ